MGKALTAVYDKLPQNVRDAIGRFVKVIAAAAFLAAGAAVISHFQTNGNFAVTTSEVNDAVLLAVVSALEKFFGIAPGVATKTRSLVGGSAP